MGGEEASCPWYPQRLAWENNRNAINEQPILQDVGKQNAKLFDNQSDTYQPGAQVKPISKTFLFCLWLKLAIFATDK